MVDSPAVVRQSDSPAQTGGCVAKEGINLEGSLKVFSFYSDLIKGGGR